MQQSQTFKMIPEAVNKHMCTVFVILSIATLGGQGALCNTVLVLHRETQGLAFLRNQPTDYRYRYQGIAVYIGREFYEFRLIQV